MADENKNEEAVAPQTDAPEAPAAELTVASWSNL